MNEKKMLKKFVCMAVCIALLFSLPLMAFAYESPERVQGAEETAPEKAEEVTQERAEALQEQEPDIAAPEGGEPEEDGPVLQPDKEPSAVEPPAASAGAAGKSVLPEEGEAEDVTAAQPADVKETDEAPASEATVKNETPSVRRAVKALRAASGSVDNSTKLPDGEYTGDDFEFKWEGGTGKARLILDSITVSGGRATGHFTASSDSITHVYYLGHTSGNDEDPAFYDPDTGVCGDGVKAISGRSVSFPVRLNSSADVALRTVAMSAPHWVQYSYTITIDETEKEIVTPLSVTNTVKGLAVTAAELGVMEKSGKKTLRITCGDKTFTKFYPGTAAEARTDGNNAAGISGGKVFSVSSVVTDKNTKAAFYRKSDGIWHDATMKIDTAAASLTLTEGKKADYSKVEAARAKVPADLSPYKASRVKALKDALSAVEEGLYASEQARVDGFASAIEKAVAALEKDKLTVTFKAVDSGTGKAISGASFTVKDSGGKTVKAVSAGVYRLADGTYSVTVSAKNYEDGVLEKYSPSVEETVTVELEPKEILPEGTTVFRENEKDPSRTNLFNTTAMFRVVKGVLVSNGEKSTLTVTLSGSGYHYLFKGTYEECLAGGINKKNWIKGSVNADGKWEFVIPVDPSETLIPIVSISDAHLEKAEKGEETLGDAVFARQLTIDPDAMTLTAGDYDAVLDVTVVSKSDVFRADGKGTMEVIGGPNSNNYACKPVITMLDGRFSMAFIGTAADAAKKGAAVIKLKGSAFSFSFVNSFGENGQVRMFEDKKPVAVAFYDTQEKKWTDYKLTIDKTALKITVEPLKDDEKPPAVPEKEKKDDSSPGTGKVDNSTTLADGVYQPDSFSFSGGTGKVRVLCDRIEVKNGQTFATIRFTKKDGSPASVDRLRAGGKTFSGSNTFTIPVVLNKNNRIVGRTTAMSQPHWIEYTIFIALAAAGSGEQGSGISENTSQFDEEAPAILGLKATGAVETPYTDLVRIFGYEGGYYLIELDAVRDTARDTLEYRTGMELEELRKAKDDAETEEPAEQDDASAAQDDAEEETAADDSLSALIAGLYRNEIIKYLVIPSDGEVPAGMDKEIIIIKQPQESAYVSSEEALDMITELGLEGRFTSQGFGDGAAAGSMEYAGPFDDWDLRSMIMMKTDLAVQSSDILPQDAEKTEEDMDNLVRLGERAAQMGMAMFIDRSADETTDIGRYEWYKVYGVILGDADKAAELYDRAAAGVSDADKAAASALIAERTAERDALKKEAGAAAAAQL